MAGYDAVLRDYVAEMRVAREKALAWWEALLAKEAALPPAQRPGLPVDLRWPAGPASHPAVIAVYRKYFLLVDELNERGEGPAEEPEADAFESESSWGEEDDEAGEPADATVEPRPLLLDNVVKVDEEVHAFVQMLVFNPVGTDPSGRYV